MGRGIFKLPPYDSSYMSTNDSSGTIDEKLMTEDKQILSSMSGRRDFLRLGGAALTGAVAASNLSSTAKAERSSGKDSYTPENSFFNADHAPIGANASFALGYPGDRDGSKGGIGISDEIETPPDDNIYIGGESSEGDEFRSLPFFDPDTGGNDLAVFEKEQIERDYRMATDTWVAEDITFRLFSPIKSIPDPHTGDPERLRDVLAPAVCFELTIDNTDVTEPRTAFFGYQSDENNAQVIKSNDISGVTVNDATGQTGIFSYPNDYTKPVVGSSMVKILSGETTDTGSTAAFLVEIPPGEEVTCQFAVGFYDSGTTVSGPDIETSYYYTRFFDDIEAVGQYTLENFENFVADSERTNAKLEQPHLSDDQKFMLAHSIHSYYQNTELLQREGDEQEGEPLWVVEEGEYRFLNTADLMVDHLFFEMQMNPWVVRNLLDTFIERYSYRDNIGFPSFTTDDPRASQGGIAFTHDMGQGTEFSRPGYSAYEQPNKRGVFSYMTHEELVNWLLCASVYVTQTQNGEWLNEHRDTFAACLRSMINRDHPEPEQRNGVMSLDSTRCGEFGWEITTYDSLDASLGQARHNTYLATKCWAAYVALERLFEKMGCDDLAMDAGMQAERCANTLVSNTNEVEDGEYIPAVLGIEGESEVASRIIPVIEGLVFPYFTGTEEALDPDGRFGTFIQTLRTHFKTIFERGTCIFSSPPAAAGGWKLSSTSANSWLSKIYLNQFITREILDIHGEYVTEIADETHVSWLTNPDLSYWAWSDQIIDGDISASRYYPRGVTSILWLNEGE